MANILHSPPHAFLDKSSHLASEALLQMASPYDLAQRNTIVTLQRRNPGLLNRHLVAANPYVARKPKIPKRGVNSFMAFRAYYSRMFAKFQQKNSSTLLKRLWDNDPWKAKWSIVARSFTSLRDAVGKAHAPLSTFLDIVCPKIGIISVEEYLDMMNWVVEKDNDSVELKQYSPPDFSVFPDRIVNTLMTERDVIFYCAFKGYISARMSVKIAGPFPQSESPSAKRATSQQGLLASAPPQCMMTPNEAFNTETNVSSETAAASQIFGSDIDATMEMTDTICTPFEWSNNDYDLYTAGEGVFDFESYFSKTQVDPWDSFNIDDPQAMNGFLTGGGIQEGYVSPEALPEYTPNPL